MTYKILDTDSLNTEEHWEQLVAHEPQKNCRQSLDIYLHLINLYNGLKS